MKYLSNIDLNKNELQNARLQNLGAAPANPVAGQVYYNSADNCFYGFNGSAWIDLGQVLNGTSIVSLINGSKSIIADGNLSTAANDAIIKRHSHSNSSILNAMEQAFTTALKNKLDGIAANANNYTHPSTHSIDMITESTSKKIMTADERTKLSGIATGANNYVHPGSGTNPHGTTKSDVGLGSVDNKSSETIRNEITSANINKALGFTPKKILQGLESARPTATGSMILYIATDTKKIWLDTAVDTWLQVGGQDTIAWGSITGKPTTFPPATHNHDTAYLGKTAKAESSKVADSVAWGNVGSKPSTFTPPKATDTVLGGIKVGVNLSVDADGTLNANDNPLSYIVKQEKFIATDGQTMFNLTKGKYRQGIGAIAIFLNGVKIANTILEETSQTSFTLKSGLSAGDYLLAEYIELTNVEPYLVHSNEHLTGGTDPIPLATSSKDGLMKASDKGKLDGIATGANNYTHPSTHPASVVVQDANNRFVTDAEKTAWNGKAAGNHNHKLADLSEKSYDSLTNKPSLGTAASKNVGTASGQIPLLDSSGKLSTSILPALAISDTFVVSTQAAMLALTAEVGDICVRTDLKKSFILKTAGANTLANWQELLTPTDSVISVNGMTGAVTVNKSHVGLSNVDNVQQASKAEFNTHNADTTKHITAAERTTWNSRTKKYAADIGNGTLTTIPVTHNLGSMDVTITIREKATPYNVVLADIQFVDNNKFNILFAAAPTSNQYRVTVVG